MSTALHRFLAAGASLSLLVGVGFAQEAVVGPMMASGGAGQDVDFNIVYQGPARVNGISFDMIYQADAMAAFTPIFESGSPTHIACSTAADLSPDIKTTAVLLPGHGRIAFTVIGLNLSTGPVAFGRSGILGTCQFVIAPDAAGTIPLLCDRTTPVTASDALDGKDVSIACVDGALTVEGSGGAGSRGRGAAAGAIGEPPVVDAGSGGAAAPGNEPMRPAQQAGRPANAPLAQAGQAGPAATAQAAAPTEAMATATAAVRPTPSLPPRTAAAPESSATQGAATPPVRQPTATTAPPPRPSATKHAAAAAQPTPEEKSGCTIAAGTRQRGYWLLVPAAALMMIRSRRLRFRSRRHLEK